MPRFEYRLNDAAQDYPILYFYENMRTGQQPLHLNVKFRFIVGNQAKHRPILPFPQKQFAFRCLANVYFHQHLMVGLLQFLGNLQHFFIHGGQLFIGGR